MIFISVCRTWNGMKPPDSTSPGMSSIYLLAMVLRIIPAASPASISMDRAEKAPSTISLRGRESPSPFNCLSGRQICYAPRSLFPRMLGPRVLHIQEGFPQAFIYATFNLPTVLLSRHWLIVMHLVPGQNASARRSSSVSFPKSLLRYVRADLQMSINA